MARRPRYECGRFGTSALGKLYRDQMGLPGTSSRWARGHNANDAVQHGGWYWDGGITEGHVGLMASHDRDGLALLGLRRQELHELLNDVLLLAGCQLGGEIVGHVVDVAVEP